MYEQKSEHRFCFVTNFNIHVIMLCLSEKCFTFRIHDFRYLKLIRRMLNALFNTFHTYFTYISLIICPQTAIYPSYMFFHLKFTNGCLPSITWYIYKLYLNIKSNINCIKLYIILRTFFIRFGRCTLISGRIVLGEKKFRF